MKSKNKALFSTNSPSFLFILNLNHLLDLNKNAGKQSTNSYNLVGQIWVRPSTASALIEFLDNIDLVGHHLDELLVRYYRDKLTIFFFRSRGATSLAPEPLPSQCFFKFRELCSLSI